MTETTLLKRKPCLECKHATKGMVTLHGEICRKCAYYVYYIANAKSMWEAKSHD
jgi:hypothetical protein